MNFRILKSLGPGLLFAGAAIGVSHLVQSTKAGAQFGFGLLWALLIVHLFKYPFFQFGTRYSNATGETLLDGYAKLGKGVLIAYFILNFATMFTIQAAVTIVTAGLASTIFGLSENLVLWSSIIICIAFLILTIGKYQILDRIMKYIIIVLTTTTIVAVIVAFSQNTTPVTLIQVLPKNSIEISFLIAFLGWMPAPLDVSIWQSLWTVEKQKTSTTTTSQKQALFDFNVGYLSTLFIGLCFISLGAFVMYNSGENFDNGAINFSKQLIAMYTESLGTTTYIIIAFAAFTTMFSTTITTLDASPRTMTKTIELYTSKKHKNGYWLWILTLAIGTLIILGYFSSTMSTLIKIATVLSFLSAPFFALLNYLLITGKHTPKEAQPGKLLRLISLGGILFLVSFSLWFLTTL